MLLRSPEVHLEDIKEVWQKNCCWKAMENANLITNLPILNGLWEVFWWWLWSHRMTTVNGWSYRNTIEKNTFQRQTVICADSCHDSYWFILVVKNKMPETFIIRYKKPLPCPVVISHAPPPEVPNPQPILEISEKSSSQVCWYRGCDSFEDGLKKCL